MQAELHRKLNQSKDGDDRRKDAEGLHKDWVRKRMKQVKEYDRG